MYHWYLHGWYMMVFCEPMLWHLSPNHSWKNSHHLAESTRARPCSTTMLSKSGPRNSHVHGEYGHKPWNLEVAYFERHPVFFNASSEKSVASDTFQQPTGWVWWDARPACGLWGHRCLVSFHHGKVGPWTGDSCWRFTTLSAKFGSDNSKNWTSAMFH